MNKRYRLRNNSEFEKVYRYGKSIAHPLLVLVHKKSGFTVVRAGFSASKKYGKAVARNKIRRRLKHILQKRIPCLKTGYDIIFVVRKDAKKAGYSQLEGAVENLLKRARMFKDVK